MRRHHGSLTAERPKKVLTALKRGAWLSAMDLIRTANVTNPAEVISGLRFNGIQIEKKDFITQDGKRVNYWRLVK